MQESALSELADTEGVALADLTYEQLARTVADYCKELARREQAHREDQLEHALRIWPDLKRALRAKDKKVGLNDFAEPTIPGWSEVPVVPISGTCGPKPKTKRQAMEIALTVGDGSWADLGELWLWLNDTGPIVDRTLRKYGYLKPTAKPPPGER